MTEKDLAMSESLCVRLKPHQPRAGHVLRQFAYRGILFRAGSGWTKVSHSVAEHLRGVKQRAHDPYSALAFDVCTDAEARRLDADDAERSQTVTPVDKARTALARDEPSSIGGAVASPTPPGAQDTNKDRPSARAKH